MANLLMHEFDSTEDIIRNSVERIWCREVREEELERSMGYIRKMEQYHEQNDPVATEYPTSITRHMFEEMTGESFTYEEELDIYQDYVPDLQPTDVDARTRAVADYVAVLFNSNEFVYVY